MSNDYMPNNQPYNITTMNKQRRSRIERVISMLSDAYEELVSIRDEEQEAFDNLPEWIQESERGQSIEDCANELDDAVSELDGLISTINDILDTY